MKVLHHIAGNTPKYGYFSCASSSFPQNNWASKVTSMRLPMGSGARDKNSAVGVVETQRSYEIHSLDYDRIGLVHSAEGVLVKPDGTISGRSHAYSHIVSLVDDAGCTTGSPETWMQFGDFMPLEDFWRSTMNNNTLLEETDWTPVATVLPPWNGAVSGDFQDALVLRYWKSATRRFFDGQNDTLRVCLSDQKDHEAVIAESKQFFWSKILSALPKAVWHTLSMSAAVKHDAVQVYQPTALVFLLPAAFVDTAGNERFFDARTETFVPLTALEKAFIGTIRKQGSTSSLSALYKQYAATVAHASAFEHASFVADHTLVWLLFRLEQDELTDAERVQLWQDVHARLEKQHGFTWQQVDAMLSALEQPLFLQPMKDAIAFTDAAFRFLLSKALRLKDDTAAKGYTVLLEKHQHKEFAPFFAVELNEQLLRDAVGDMRIQSVAGMLFAACDVNEARRSELISDNMIALCNTCPALLRTVQGYLMDQYRQHEGQSLFLLPLGVVYLDRHQVLANALQLLKREYVQMMPNESVCQVLMMAQDAFDASNCALLDTYLLECFRVHQPNIRPLLSVCEALGQDSRNFLCSVLQGNERYDAYMLSEMLGRLLPLCSDRESVHRALLAYVERVLNDAVSGRQQELDWLRVVDNKGLLISGKERATHGLQHFIDYYGAQPDVPAQAHFVHAMADLDTLGQQGRAVYEDGVKKIYEQLGDAGCAQLQQLLDAVGFATVSDTSYIRSVYVDMLRWKLVDGWKKLDFFKSIDQQRSRWGMGSVTPDELLQQGVIENAKQALQSRYANFQAAKPFEQEGRLIDQQPADAFAYLAKDLLAQTMDSRYESILLNESGMEQAVYTAQVARKLQAIRSQQSIQAQSVLDEMRRIQAFILRDLPAYAWDNVAAETQNRIRSLVRIGRHPLADTMQEWLYKEMQTAAGLTFRKRMAAICLLGTRSDGAVSGKRLLSILALNEKACAAPFAAENLPLFSQIGALFAFAESIDESYATALRKALSDGSWANYTGRVKAQRKQAGKLIPWMMDDAIGLREKVHPTKAFVRWMTE